MDLRIGQVSSGSPQLSVPYVPRTDVDFSQVMLQVRRVGTPLYFAEYAPLSTANGVLLFQFDTLLFTSPLGRYEGVIQYNGVSISQLQFQLTVNQGIPAPLQISTTEPYVPCYEEFGNCNNGTGIEGAGTFLYLKDAPKSYAGQRGRAAIVNDTETGLTFGSPAPTTILAYDNVAELPPNPNTLIEASLAVISIASVPALYFTTPGASSWTSLQGLSAYAGPFAS
jgi:hypothetical protein